MTPDPEDDGVPPLSDIPRPMPPKFLCSTPLALEMMKDMVPECEDDQCTIGWTPPPNTAVKVAEMNKEDRL